MQGNGDEQVREDPMTELRRRVREFAGQGLQVSEIWDRLDGPLSRAIGELNEAELEVLSRVVRSEVASAGRNRPREP
jgi:hypothetical protein